MALLLGKAKVEDVIHLFDGLVAEGIDGAPGLIGLRQFQRRRLEIEAIENDQIGAGQEFAIRRDGLESVRIDPLRNDPGELNFFAGDVSRCW